MKNKIIKIISVIAIIITIIGVTTPTIYARAHSSGARSSGSHSSSVKSSTPKSSTKSSTSSSVKASTPKSSTTKSSTSGKSYTTTKNNSGRTTVNHDTVKPKTDSSGKSTIVNNNPTYYTTYSTETGFSLTNSIFQFYMLDQIFSDKEKVTEQDVAKALEERGYSKEEVDQILDEARTEEKANKPFYDGWKWYNWLLFVVIILAIIGGVVGLAIWLTW